MKTTIELPDALFREAKATAARRGTSLKTLMREALEEKLSRDKGIYLVREGPPQWPVPPAPFSPEDRLLFDEAIEEFEQIEPDEHPFDPGHE